MQQRYAWILVLPLLLLLAFSPGTAWASDVLTQHNNNARTGATLDESTLNTANVNSTTFGKLWTLYTDGQVVAEPLYVSGLQIDTSAAPNTPLVRGTFNAVIIATMHNTVYVYDADKENRGPDGRTIPLWAKWLGPPRPSGKDIDMWSTNDPEWGILSTPVVSDDKTTLYLVSWHNDGAAGYAFRLHALDLKSGADLHPPVMIGKASTDPSQPCHNQSPFNPCLHKQRAGLLLNKGMLYIAFGGDGNRGALFVFDAATLTQRTFWSPTPSGNDGGIWQSGQGLTADADGNVYLMVGNGTFGTNNGSKNFGSSFLKLALQGQDLVVEDSFTPCNQDWLRSLDLDVGSSGPLLLTGTPGRIIGGGKEGVLYVLAADKMGGYAASPTAPNCTNPNAIQQVLAFPSVQHGGVTHYGNIHGSPVYWNGPDTGRIYAWGENNHLKAYKFSDGMLQDVNNPQLSAFRPPDGMPGGMLTISANGNQAGTGIVWAVVPLDGDANQQRGVKGIVLALDAQNVGRTLWTSEQFAQRDRLGLFAKFANPVVAAGKVFVATYGDNEPRATYGGGARPTQFPQNYYVAVYGILENPGPQKPIVNQNSDDVSVVRASTAPLTLDTSKCTAMDGTSVDCTDALSAASNAPAFHRVILAANGNVTGCTVVRITTASKNTGLANSSGIGFYSSTVSTGNLGAEDSGRFVPKAQLHVVGNGNSAKRSPGHVA